MGGYKEKGDRTRTSENAFDAFDLVLRSTLTARNNKLLVEKENTVEFSVKPDSVHPKMTDKNSEAG